MKQVVTYLQCGVYYQIFIWRIVINFSYLLLRFLLLKIPWYPTILSPVKALAFEFMCVQITFQWKLFNLCSGTFKNVISVLWELQCSFELDTEILKWISENLIKLYVWLDIDVSENMSVSVSLTWQQSRPRSSSECWGYESAYPACWRSVRILAGQPSLSASNPAWAGGAPRGNPWAGAADSPHQWPWSPVK